MITWLASLIALLWLISSSLWVGIAIGEKFEKDRWIEKMKGLKND